MEVRRWLWNLIKRIFSKEISDVHERGWGKGFRFVFDNPIQAKVLHQTFCGENVLLKFLYSGAHNFRLHGTPKEKTMSEKPVIVCLCGSGRFKEAYDKAEYDETLAGKIVLTIGCNMKDVARDPELESHKPALDELHLRKIDLADEVLILNVGGYIGESTRNELEYAIEHGKLIRYLEEPDEN